MTRVAVLGTGSWGTAFALVLADAGAEVRMWGRRAEVCAAVAAGRGNPAYLPGVALPAAVSATTDARRALQGADVVVLALPSQSLRGVLEGVADAVPTGAPLVSLAKGLESGTRLRMSEVVAQASGAARERVAVLSGPNLAREIAERQPTATVVAAHDADVAAQVAAACATPAFRPYTHHDVLGVELGGVVKNVVGLAVGMAEGLGWGDNAKASIITRGLAQTSRLAVALGAEAATMAGLAGMGDLVATCASPLSRNHQTGVQLGRGLSVAAAARVVEQTAEGVRSAPSVLALAREAGVEMPIVEQVVDVVEGRVEAREAARLLLARDLKHEGD
ncbi:NAD(P)H-dependent glycerol-3-phosphate dehydrogenase [uncultured Pseudokineococcus sp.]|uniref:NAD(P)H-dependent glycerol-3-phosphate dehydrogenase n=1 Tax=uncultured Pseudokineococcus sp. TaxID=1642928 RepID=UPI002632C76D|nr:NAD(P)H-dependent glycerol-3-phosphate dehydrogenase [uncultured Pseudokineococcus sp.]